jgi:hypothetical protein
MAVITGQPSGKVQVDIPKCTQICLWPNTTATVYAGTVRDPNGVPDQPAVTFKSVYRSLKKWVERLNRPNSWNTLRIPHKLQIAWQSLITDYETTRKPMSPNPLGNVQNSRQLGEVFASKSVSVCGELIKNTPIRVLTNRVLQSCYKLNRFKQVRCYCTTVWFNFLCNFCRSIVFYNKLL